MSTRTYSPSRTRPYTLPSRSVATVRTSASPSTHVATNPGVAQKIDWFTVMLYALMFIGIGGFTMLAYMIIGPAA